MTYSLIGHLRRGPAPNTIEGELRCPTFHTTYTLTGTRAADGSYALTATTGPIPEGLRLDWDDLDE